MLHIYSFPQTRGVRVIWACQELQIPYEYHVIDLYKGEHKSADYLAKTPTGKVPLIIDEDCTDASGNAVTIAESGAIVTYLADKVGKLIPQAGTAERAYFEEVMYFVISELEQPLWTQAKHKFALPEDKRLPEVIALGEWEFQKALGIFSKMLGDKDYVLGSAFSIADVIAGHVLSWAQGFEQVIEQENVKAYTTRVLTRPALKQARKHEKEIKESL